jgi:hypothetical protein
MPSIMVSIAARHTVPAPMVAMAGLGRLLPNNDRMRKPSKGNAGMNGRRLGIVN